MKMIELGADIKTLKTADLLQDINATIANIRDEERRLRKYIEHLRKKRIELDRRYNDILEGKK